MGTKSPESIRICDAAGEPSSQTEEQTRKSERVPTTEANMFGDETDENDMMALVDLLNGLTADDPKLQERALALAEELIMDDDDLEVVDEAGDTTGVSSYETKKKQEEDDYVFEEIHADTFIEDLSQDEVNERKKTRKERKVKSDIYRQNGNICCSKSDYEEAVRCYTEAIDLIRDSPSLYTNRALANIKLGHNVEAIEDCNKAIFLADKSLKARLYKAKALHMNGKHLECIACFDESRKTLPAYVKQIDHCQMSLFTEEQGDVEAPQKESDVFPGESFMRLAASYNVAKMSTFFEDSPLKRAKQKEN